ncbi:hypothetical protein DBR44_09560 [Aquitalea sp. FJL05]|uniref:hypothetical protein n=1 Tax=Aquitalea sp. FJL05 TaxID=2153366 RepID=UPI000F594119|nr:hypothetical protein [Aquitalea sp. FJL05]RQO73152.1 hypothetical protein DBR44_09560 [Aquitalea sp. FJL05]
MKTKRILAVVSTSLAVMLAGCSNSPSEADARKAVENAIGSCDNVKVTDFEKINGISSGDNYYTLQVKYAIEFKAFDKNINVAKDILGQAEKFQSEVVQPSQVRRDAYEQARKEAVSSGKYENAAAYDMDHSAEWEKYNIDNNVATNPDWVLNNFTNKGRAILTNNLRELCPNMNQVVYQEYAKAAINKHLDTFKVPFENNKLTMIKSDNGWINR